MYILLNGSIRAEKGDGCKCLALSLATCGQAPRTVLSIRLGAAAAFALKRGGRSCMAPCPNRSVGTSHRYAIAWPE